MAIRVKTAGAWSAPIASGKLAVKSGGVWKIPSAVYVKANGAWFDTGYRGAPAPPSAPWVHAWDYGNVQIGWNAGSGGAPISKYQIVQTDSAGNWMYQYEVNGSPSTWGQFPVAQNGYYMYYVRSKTASGLYSGFAGPLKVHIGTASSYYETTEQGVRAWGAGIEVEPYGIKDYLCGVTVPSNVYVHRIRWDLGCPYGVLSPWNNRSIDLILNETFTWVAGVNWPWSEVHADDYVDFGGNGGRTGFICRGAGWTVSPGGASRVWGQVNVYGDESYSYQQGHWTTAVGNGYW